MDSSTYRPHCQISFLWCMISQFMKMNSLSLGTSIRRSQLLLRQSRLLLWLTSQLCEASSAPRPLKLSDTLQQLYNIIVVQNTLKLNAVNLQSHWIAAVNGRIEHNQDKHLVKLLPDRKALCCQTGPHGQISHILLRIILNLDSMSKALPRSFELRKFYFRLQPSSICPSSILILHVPAW